jgi:hypothetical protein
MTERETEKRPETIKQCTSLGAAIVLVSFLLMYFSPTWPSALSVLALCAMGGTMTFFLCRQDTSAD